MKKTYQGSCHCGAVRFEIDAVLDHVRICDCSVCRRRGALNFRVCEADFHLQTPLQDLALYQWGSLTAKDYFCSTCGILPFRRPGHPTADELLQGIQAFTGWTINARCLEGVDLDVIPVQRIQGSSIS
jgi:hypothetical protein